MKRLLLITLLLVVGFSSGQEPIDESTLDRKDGLFYAPDSDKPYSGVAVRYYGNGQKMREGTYKDGKEDGVWTSWDKNGQKEKEGIYKGVDKYGNPQENGIWTWWDEKGQKELEENYKDGKRGLSTFWYINGRKKWEGIFKDYILDSLWTFWNEDGDIKRKLNFRDGIPDGEYDSWSPGASNPYILAEGVFNAFRDDDVIEFIQLLGDDESYEKMESSFMSFSRLRREMLNIGVNWSEAEFTETRIYTSPASFTVLRKEENISLKNGTNTKDFPIIFKSGDKSYVIKLDNCVYSNGKWFSGNPNDWELLDDY